MSGLNKEGALLQSWGPCVFSSDPLFQGSAWDVSTANNLPEHCGASLPAPRTQEGHKGHPLDLIGCKTGRVTLSSRPFVNSSNLSARKLVPVAFPQ